MRVFVAGASGAIGRPLVAQLVAAGHTVVGMTRSGTTLIEQILASHPQVFGAGERPLFDQAAGSIRHSLPGHPPFPDMVPAMSGEHFRALVEAG